MTDVYDDVTDVYDDVTYVYDDVTCVCVCVCTAIDHANDDTIVRLMM